MNGFISFGSDGESGFNIFMEIPYVDDNMSIQKILYGGHQL